MSDLDSVLERLSSAIARIEGGLEMGLESLKQRAEPVQQPSQDGPAVDGLEDVTESDNGKAAAQQTLIDELRAELAKNEKALEDAKVADASLEAQATEHDDQDDGKADLAELEALRAELAQERAANDELGARVEVLRTRLDEQDGARDTQLERRTAQIADLDQQIQRLQQVNADLREINGQMRRAIAGNVADAELINRAMEAELDALRAARAAEAAEVQAVIDELKPIVEGAD